jgi:phenylacetic acid degradation operon negative regulatory protein
VHDQLRRRSVGVPAARSLLLTVLGEFVLPRAEPVWQETLVAALVCLGYTRPAARQALARSVREGWLYTERRGRRARVRLTERTASLLRAGAARIYSFGEPRAWHGRWLLVTLRVPEERREVRHQLRTRLAWAGMGSLGGGVWLTPHVERESELANAIREEPAAEATSFVAELGSLGDPGRLASIAWDLSSVRDRYSAFVDEFARERPSAPAEFFRAQALLVHAWRRFPFLDPDLPAPLLPERWPRERAHALFHELHARWACPARDHFDTLSPERSSPKPAPVQNGPAPIVVEQESTPLVIHEEDLG